MGYKLGNGSKEYELITDYLGWLPKGETDWDILWGFNLDEEKPKEIILESKEGKRVNLLIDHVIIKDAFPLDFYGEERAKDWFRFCIVSKKEAAETKFIIPLH